MTVPFSSDRITLKLHLDDWTAVKQLAAAQRLPLVAVIRSLVHRGLVVPDTGEVVQQQHAAAEAGSTHGDVVCFEQLLDADVLTAVDQYVAEGGSLDRETAIRVLVTEGLVTRGYLVGQSGSSE